MNKGKWLEAVKEDVVEWNNVWDESDANPNLISSSIQILGPMTVASKCDLQFSIINYFHHGTFRHSVKLGTLDLTNFVEYLMI